MKINFIVLMLLTLQASGAETQEKWGTVFDWASFFVAKEGQPGTKENSRKLPTVVHNGERFGHLVYYATTKKEIVYRLELMPPGSPENFSCSTCSPGELTISKDRKTVVLSRILDQSKYKGPTHNQGKLDYKEVSFGWGINAKDPRGEYQLKAWVDGEAIGDGIFNVR